MTKRSNFSGLECPLGVPPEELEVADEEICAKCSA